MPFTPYHFGPGLALHSAAPRRIDFVAFCMANVLTDIEPLYHMLRGEYPVHGFFHGFAGATVTAAVTTLLFLAARNAPAVLSRWRSTGPWPIVLGATLGTWTHVVLDGIMHPDIRPFTPFSDVDPFFHHGSGRAVRAACVAAWSVGALVLLVRRSIDTS